MSIPIIAKVIYLLRFELQSVNQINLSNDIPKDFIVVQSNLSGSIKLGRNCNFKGANLIGVMEFDKNCKINYAKIAGNVKVGRNTSLWGPNLDIHCKGGFVNIGSYCSIARNVSIQTYNHNYKKITTYYIGQNFFKEKWENEMVQKGKIEIGNDVWIGAHSVVLGGVKIGNGAVIAANSVVTKDIPPYAIAGGMPAKVLKYRFSNEIIERLEQIEWWNWDDETLNKNKWIFEEDLSLANLDRIA